VLDPVRESKEWLAARKQLLAEEKEFSRLRDRLNQRRRELPWESVDKELWMRRGGALTKRAASDSLESRTISIKNRVIVP
jgi:predicted dithiol-disulfide oxidoreductase (DUF899 family)